MHCGNPLLAYWRRQCCRRAALLASGPRAAAEPQPAPPRFAQPNLGRRQQLWLPPRPDTPLHSLHHLHTALNHFGFRLGHRVRRGSTTIVTLCCCCRCQLLPPSTIARLARRRRIVAAAAIAAAASPDTLPPGAARPARPQTPARPARPGRARHPRSPRAPKPVVAARPPSPARHARPVRPRAIRRPGARLPARPGLSSYHHPCHRRPPARHRVIIHTTHWVISQHVSSLSTIYLFILSPRQSLANPSFVSLQAPTPTRSPSSPPIITSSRTRARIASSPGSRTGARARLSRPSSNHNHAIALP